MKKKPNHLDIIINEEDSAGTHPNLVVHTDTGKVGLTITHSGKNMEHKKLLIKKKDIEEGSKFQINTKNPSYLSNNMNVLQRKKYKCVGKAKQSLISRFISYLSKLIK